MARKVEVEIVGDSRQLERAFSRSSRSATKFQRDIGRTFRGAAAGSGVFGGMGRSIAFASTTFLGGAGLIAGMRGAIDAASDLNEQMAKTNTVFGDSATEIEDWATTAANAMGLSERQALATASSFGALFRPLGLVGPQAAEQSKALTQLGADLASFYNTDVQDALDAVRSGLIGEAEPLRRYGVVLSETRVQQEALRETGKKHAAALTLQEKALARIAIMFRDAQVATGDFAKTSGGLANQTRIAQANLDDLRVKIGLQLVPAVTHAITGFNQWIAQSKNQERVLHDVHTVVGAVTAVVNALRAGLADLNSITGSTRHSVELLAAAFVAFKAAKLIGAIADVAAGVGLIGKNAERSAGQVGRLRIAARLGAVGAAVIALKIVDDATGQPIERADSWLENHVRRPAKRFLRRGFVVEKPAVIEMVSDAASGHGYGNAPQVAAAATAATATAKAVKEIARFGAATPWLDYLQALAESTKSTADDLQVVRQVIVVLTGRLAKATNLKDRTAILAAINQWRGEEQAITAALRESNQEAEKARKAARLAARERATARATAQQFQALGLGPTGEELIPNTASLRQRFAKLEGKLGQLDPAARKMMARIRKLFAGPFRKLTAEVRSVIDQFFDSVADGVNQGAQNFTQYRWKRPNADALAKLLGLTPAQTRKLAVALTRGGGGQPPLRSGQYTGGGTVVHGDIHVHGPWTNWRQVEDAIAKRNRARGKQRRGAR